MTPQGAGSSRLGWSAASLVLGGLVLILAVAAVPLARLAHQSLNAATASVPVWVTAPGAVWGLVVARRKPGNPLGWLILSASIFSMQQALEPAHVSVWISAAGTPEALGDHADTTAPRRW